MNVSLVCIRGSINLGKSAKIGHIIHGRRATILSGSRNCSWQQVTGEKTEDKSNIPSKRYYIKPWHHSHVPIKIVIKACKPLNHFESRFKREGERRAAIIYCAMSHKAINYRVSRFQIWFMNTAGTILKKIEYKPYF